MKNTIMILVALLMSAVSLPAQVVVPEGDTLLIKVVTSSDTIRVVELDTIFVEPDTVFATDTLVVVDTLVVRDTVVVVDTVFVGDAGPLPPPSRLSLSFSGSIITANWTDGNGQGQQFRIGNNASGIPFSGSYWACADLVEGGVITWSSCNSVIATVQINDLNTKIEDCLTQMRLEQRGIYYSPAADACVGLGDIVDHAEVNEIHVAYWGLSTVDPFPRTVGDLAVQDSN